MLQFLKQTVKDKLTLREDSSGCLWHCNTAFALHDALRSHTGSTFLLGDGAITSLCRKQGMNSSVSAEAEVVATDNISPYDMDMIISQGKRISSQGEYPLSGQQKCHVAQDQWMQECWQALSSFEHLILLCHQSEDQRPH